MSIAWSGRQNELSALITVLLVMERVFGLIFTSRIVELHRIEAVGKRALTEISGWGSTGRRGGGLRRRRSVLCVKVDGFLDVTATSGVSM